MTESQRQVPLKLKDFTPLSDHLTKEVGLVTAAVYGRVWRFCQMTDSVCTASLDRIGEDLNLDRSTVCRHIQVLVVNGYLKDLTPNQHSHQPHVYADTGKANIQITVEFAANGTSAVAHDNIEIEKKSKVPAKDVAENNKTVAENNTVLQKATDMLQKTTKETELRDKKETEKERVTPSPPLVSSPPEKPAKTAKALKSVAPELPPAPSKSVRGKPFILPSFLEPYRLAYCEGFGFDPLLVNGRQVAKLAPYFLEAREGKKIPPDEFARLLHWWAGKPERKRYGTRDVEYALDDYALWVSLHSPPQWCEANGPRPGARAGPDRRMQPVRAQAVSAPAQSALTRAAFTYPTESELLEAAGVESRP